MYAIVFKNREIKEVNDNQAIQLLKDWTDGKDKFIFKGGLISFSSVADIKPISTPAEYANPAITSPKVSYSKQKHLKHLNQIKQGFLYGYDVGGVHFKGVLDRRTELLSGQAVMVANMDRIIKTVEKSDEKEFFFDIKQFGYNS